MKFETLERLLLLGLAVILLLNCIWPSPWGGVFRGQW